MPESDRELHFSDYVLELQSAEEERRRRIRDARRRAETAQRQAFSEALRRMASEGSLLPSSRWRFVEEMITADPSFGPVQAHERDAPRDIFEDFIEEWSEVFRQDRSFLSRLVHSSPKHGIAVRTETTYDEFSKALLDEAAHSPELYSDTRRILNREDPISSARLYFIELISRARESQSNDANRPKAAVRRGSKAESSSEDEGEIREDEEVIMNESETTKVERK
jgi:pre-mRNA-processing factor 40